MSHSTDKALIGVYHTTADARAAIEDLRAANFSDKAIGVLTHDKEGDPEIKSFRELEGNHSKAGAAIGAAAGAGGGALWALAIAAGILPAIGPVIAGGLLVAIAASAATGAGAGIVVGALVGLGVTDEEAAYYDDEFSKGRTIVVVKPGDRGALANTLLNGRNSHNRYLPSSAEIVESAAAARHS